MRRDPTTKIDRPTRRKGSRWLEAAAGSSTAGRTFTIRLLLAGSFLAGSPLVAPSGPTPFVSGQAALSAQEGGRTIDPNAREAISKIRSPFCPGLMLEVCPTTSASELRDSIQVLAETGLGADSLVELIVAGYGEEYRAFPKRSGTGLWAWLMPPVFLLLGLGLVVLALRRMKEPEGINRGEAISTEEEIQLKEALADLEAADL